MQRLRGLQTPVILIGSPDGAIFELWNMKFLLQKLSQYKVFRKQTGSGSREAKGIFQTTRPCIKTNLIKKTCLSIISIT